LRSAILFKMDHIYARNILETRISTNYSPRSPHRFSSGPHPSVISSFYPETSYSEALSSIPDHQTSVHPKNIPCTSLTSGGLSQSERTSRKRKETEIFSATETLDPPPKKRKSPKSIAQKLEIVLSTISSIYAHNSRAQFLPRSQGKQASSSSRCSILRIICTNNFIRVQVPNWSHVIIQYCLQYTRKPCRSGGHHHEGNWP